MNLPHPSTRIALYPMRLFPRWLLAAVPLAFVAGVVAAHVAGWL